MGKIEKYVSPKLTDYFIQGVRNCYLLVRHLKFTLVYWLKITLLSFYTPICKTGRIMVYQCLTGRPFHMSCSNLRTPWTIHFKFHRVIGIDCLTVCILFGEIFIFHSRVMWLYSSNCRRYFVCRTVNWEPLRQFTSNFVLLLELIVFTDFSKNVSYV